MKGLKIIRAKPSNAIDIYPMLLDAAKDGVYAENPTSKEVQKYYFQAMIDELAHPMHMWFLAKRGRAYLGFLHAVMIPGRWNGLIDSIFVDSIYVVDKYRKRGVGRKLIEEFRQAADYNGIRTLTFSSPEDQTDRWAKELGAKKVRSLMRVTK